MSYEDDSLILHTDLYQINMIKTYWEKGIDQKEVVFESYFRKIPFKNSYAIYAGTEHLIQYLEKLHFTETDLEYLRETKMYSEEFIKYLGNWRCTSTIKTPKEGEVIFNNEPIVQVQGPLIDAQLLETAILNIVNYQTLIATKASRIVQVSGEDPVMEFGTRRAQEFDAALWGTRAAYIAGFQSSSNVRAGKVFGIPTVGTHAHALVQAFGSDEAAFRAYADTHKNVVFLVDTFDTLKSGIPAAIKVAKEYGDKINFLGIRLDSGDLAYLSKKARKMLDDAGFPNARIYASNDLDEETILNLRYQGAKINGWGIGTKLITAFDNPALGAVYKMVAIERDGKLVDTIKLSNNISKISTPGKKQIWRLYKEGETHAMCDYLAYDTEDVVNEKELKLFDPKNPYVYKKLANFKARPVLETICECGKITKTSEDIDSIRNYRKQSLDELWEEYLRMLNPAIYHVDLSPKLYNNKQKLIENLHNKTENL